MEHFLAGDGTIGVEEVYPLTPELAVTQRCSETLGDDEHPGRGGGVDVGEGDVVRLGDDEQVAGVDRVDVQEGIDQLVSVNKAGRCPAIHDGAEDAGSRARVDGGSLFCWLPPNDIGASDPCATALLDIERLFGKVVRTHVR